MWLFAIALAQTGPKSVVIQSSGMSVLQGVFNALKTMEIRSGHSELYVILHVNVVEGCPLSGVPLHSILVMHMRHTSYVIKHKP